MCNQWRECVKVTIQFYKYLLHYHVLILWASIVFKILCHYSAKPCFMISWIFNLGFIVPKIVGDLIRVHWKQC